MAEHRDWDTKMHAAIAYLMTGSSVEAGRITDVPDRTIRSWMQQPWWEDLLTEAKTVKQKELDAIWTSLIHKVVDKLRDRINDGDAVLTRTGEVKYVPIKAKDLAFVMALAVDKRALLRGQATSRRESVTIEKKLETLEQGFSDLTQKNDKPETIN